MSDSAFYGIFYLIWPCGTFFPFFSCLTAERTKWYAPLIPPFLICLLLPHVVFSRSMTKVRSLLRRNATEDVDFFEGLRTPHASFLPQGSNDFDFVYACFVDALKGSGLARYAGAPCPQFLFFARREVGSYHLHFGGRFPDDSYSAPDLPRCIPLVGPQESDQRSLMKAAFPQGREPDDRQGALPPGV